jgi:hypothetical protein
MLPSTRRLVVFTLLVATAAAANADAAMADVSPASTALTATSRDTQLSYSGTTISCTTADATGTTPVRGTSALSASLTFGQRGGRCRAFGWPITVTCRGSATLRQTTFSAGSGTGTTAFDADFNCTLNIPSLGCNITIQGPQANVATWDFTNATQTLRYTGTNLAATDSGGLCSGNTSRSTRRGTSTFTGNYRPNVRLTDS